MEPGPAPAGAAGSGPGAATAAGAGLGAATAVGTARSGPAAATTTAAGRPGPVAIARCVGYEVDALRAALYQVLAPLGGMAAFVGPGERIGLKPNIILPSSPDKAICTHPLLVAAVAMLVREAGAHPVVVESPGAGIVPLKSVMAGVFRRAGYREVADRFGFELSTETDWEVVSHPEGRAVHRVELLSSALACDGIINLPKFKTHTFMVLGGATKNLFGFIPGLAKVGYHAKLAEPRRFADMLVDMATLVRPRLSIVDAILAMEGQGPSTSGTPRHLGLLLAGADPVAVDVTLCSIARIDTDAVPVLASAHARSLWSGRPKDIATVGVALDEVAVRDFALPGKYLDKTGLGRAGFLANGPRSLMRDGFSRRPRPKAGRCTVCGACEQACPGEAIVMDKQARVARVDDRTCIQCFCCHEVCPSAAIDLEFTGMGKMMHGLRLV